MTDKIDPKELPLVIAFTRPIGDGGSISLQTNVPQTIGPGELNILLDKINAAGRRLSAHAALEAAENHLEHVDTSEATSILEVQRLTDAAQQSPRVLTEDKNKLAQAQANIVTAGAIREKVEAKIFALRKELIGTSQH